MTCFISYLYSKWKFLCIYNIIGWGESFTLPFFRCSFFGRAVPPGRCCPGGKAVSPTVAYWGYPYNNISAYIDI